MLIKYKSTGETAHVENARGRAIIAEGLATHVSNQDFQLPKPGDAPFERPLWKVTEFVGTERRFLVIRMTIAGRTEEFSASPDQLTPRSFSWPCPELIFREYRAAWKANPSLRDALAGFGNRAVEGPHLAANEKAAYEKAEGDKQLAAGIAPRTK